MVYEKLTGEPIGGFIIFGFCYVFTVWPLAIGLILLFGSCPYCLRPKASTAGCIVN